MLLELAGTQVDAVSVGGFETCIRLPGWKLCFDIGRCPPAATSANRVLFTHAHIDHMGGVVHHAAQRDMVGKPPPEYWVPAESEADFLAMMDAWRKLAHSKLPCTVRAVRPGDRIELGKDRWVEVFRAVHRIPTVGYALHRRRHKLKEAYRHLPGPAIGELRRRGEVVTDPVDAVEVAFCGDTTADVLDRVVSVQEARLLISEVTFLDDRVSVDRAVQSGHVHLDALVERLPKLRNERLLATHVSRRHHGDIRRHFEERLPEAWRERVVWLEPEPPWI